MQITVTVDPHQAGNPFSLEKLGDGIGPVHGQPEIVFGRPLAARKSLRCRINRAAQLTSRMRGNIASEFPGCHIGQLAGTLFEQHRGDQLPLLKKSLEERGFPPGGGRAEQQGGGQPQTDHPETHASPSRCMDIKNYFAGCPGACSELPSRGTGISTSISTRRFLARPSSVALSAIGLLSP